MAFIIRKGKHSARLIRRSWVPKNSKNGNTHGYVEEVSLGSIPLTATDWPPGFASDLPTEISALSVRERAQVKTEVFDAAEEHAAKLRLEAEEREADPAWRVREATRWLAEAAPLCEQRPLDGDLFGELLAVITSLKTGGAGVGSKGDPLEALIHAAEVAAAAVAGGLYGTRPADGPMKDTPVSNLWSKVRAAVSEDEVGSLRTALQRAGWVARR
ncbi:hypothetical protein QTH97_27265 [Variovorax sp. J22R24]|uniref:hypothetical protein n=1 Tax=Variovorax gracilis TaxID=3053502 RepID=UPI002574CF1B|nr:hypothetical protein [Variovorax sp. J22R24]MDM0108676.1 hypothetical protein [Variovorax sp. J22R24]